MFDQSLNLLPQRFKKVYIPFDAYKIILAIAISLFVVLSVLSIVAFMNYQAEKDLIIAEQESQAIIDKVQEFKNNNAKKPLDATIAVRIEKYEKMLRQRQMFLKKLNGENFGNTQGFSEYLLALARKNKPNIWLQEIAIQGDANAFGLQGKAMLPTDITMYLQSLQEEPAMNGIIFDDLNMRRENHPKGNFVVFSLSYGNFAGGQDFNTQLLNSLAQTQTQIKTQTQTQTH